MQGSENKYLFISYSRKNKRIVNKVVSQLKEAGFSVWIDTSGIESGEQFKQKIVDAIEGCEVFLYFASKESNCSPWTAKEIGIATSLKKRIIPIRLDNSPFNKEVLFDIVNINYIDLSDIKSRSNNIAILISSLTSLCLITEKGEPENIQDNNISIVRNQYDKFKTKILHHKSTLPNLRKAFINKFKGFNNLSSINKVLFLKALLFNMLKSKRFWLIIILSIILVRSIIGAYQLHTYVKYACTTERKFISTAKLGDILSHDGRILATSEPKYDIYIDCTVTDQMHRYNKMSWRDKYIIAKARKAGYEFNLENAYEFSELRKLGEDNFLNVSRPGSYEKNTDDLIEAEWRHNAEALSKELSSLLLDKSAQEYFDEFLEARYSRYSKRRFIPICKGVEKVICDTITRMPLLRKGQFAGGLIVLENKQRSYPYGDLARRVLGYRKDHAWVGIDGQYDSIIKGYDGEKLTKYINFAGWKKEKLIREVPKLDGADVRTTLAIPMQQVADKILREYISRDTTIYGGTVTIMDVKTGAIRAMSNIEHKAHRNLEPVGEYYNLAIGYQFEPGSILGAASLISFLQEYGYMYQSVTHQVDSIFPFASAINRIASLNNAYYRYNYQFVHSLIQDSKYSNISAIDGVSQSNPYVLASMSLSEYGALDRYLYTLQNLGLTEDINFELKESGCLSKPRIAKPTVTDDYNYFLASLGCGYGIAMTPLQILAFYNTIANKGTKVRPYIIESIENSSRHTYRHSLIDFSSAIDEKIISQIDSVMRYSVQTGNCGIIGKAKGEIAGLAGHSLHHLGLDSDPDSGGYITTDGRSRWNSSFVGYFPVSDPKYSIICTIVTYKTDKQYPGNDIPAKIVSDIYNSL